MYIYIYIYTCLCFLIAMIAYNETTKGKYKSGRYVLDACPPLILASPGSQHTLALLLPHHGGLHGQFTVLTSVYLKPGP